MPLDVRPFLRAALLLAARRDPRLSGAKLSVRAGTEGGANFIAEIHGKNGQFFAKLRADPRDRGEREIWALEQIAGRPLATSVSASQKDRGSSRARPDESRLAPPLVWATNVREALAELADSGDERSLVREADLPSGALIITEALLGETRAVLNEADIAAAASTVAALHKIKVKNGPPLPGGATAPAMVRFVEECLERVEEIVTPRIFKALSKLVLEARKHVASAWWDLDQTPRLLCHGDLRPANLLFRDSTAQLIDFEHAGLGDPMVDLARFVVFAPLSPHQELALLDSYAEATKAQSMERYFVYRPIAPLFAAVAGAHHWALAASGEKQIRDSTYAGERQPLIEERLSKLIGEAVKLTNSSKKAPKLKTTIAVDGMAGSGKSPIASAVARKLSVPHFNTGAAYRAVALLAWEKGWSAPGDAGKLLAALRKSKLELTTDGRIVADGQLLFASLDVLQVEESVAQWAKLPEIRDALRPVLDRAVKQGPAVIEGRDVKTVLAPKAKAFYVTIDPKKRTAIVGERAGKNNTRLTKAMAARDKLDKERKVAPAVVPKDAIKIEGGDIEKAVQKILRAMK